MDIDILTGWSWKIQAPMDCERSMRPTYRHADLLSLSELVPSDCVWITQVEKMKNVVVSVEAEVWDSAGTWSDQFSVIVAAGRQCYAGQHNPLSLSLSPKKIYKISTNLVKKQKLEQHPVSLAEASNKSPFAAGSGHPLFVSPNEKGEREQVRRKIDFDDSICKA